MWDSKSDFTAESSAWSGLASGSSSGFMSKTSLSAAGFRRSDSGLRRWRSMYHLEPETPTRSFYPLGSEFWAGRADRSFGPAEGLPWLQDAHERLNTKLDSLRTREITLGYNKTMAQMLDLERKVDMGELPQFDRSPQYRALQEKVLKLENELLHMRSPLKNVSEDQPSSPVAPSSCSQSPKTPGDVKKQEEKNLTTGISCLREALRTAEERASTLEEERNKALRSLQISAEMQKMVINQMEEMKKKASDAAQLNSELQRDLREANSKINQAFLEKDEPLHRVEDLEQQLNKTTQSQQSFESHDNFTNPEFQTDGKQMKAHSKETEKQRQELEVVMEHLAESQHQLQELNEEKNKERSDLLREREEIQSKREQRGNEALKKLKENICQHSTSVEDLKLENQKLRSQCLCLEEKLREKEKILELQEKTYQKRDEIRIMRIKELEDLVSHWTEKWQNIASNLQSTQDKLEKLQADNRDSVSSLPSRFEACSQERGTAFAHMLDKDTQTDFSETSLMYERPSYSPYNRNKSQVWTQSSEVQRLKQKLAEAEREVSERQHDLKTMKRLRQMEKAEAQIRISALELKLKKKPSDCPNGRNVQTDVWHLAPVNTQQDVCNDRRNETQKPNSSLLYKYPNQYQTFSHSGQVKDEKPFIEEKKKNKTICFVDQEVEQQRRKVTEQLKSLFKERGEEAGRFADTQAPVQDGSSSAQDWTPTSLAVRAVADRRNWQQSSALMPVLEEDENGDWSGVEETDTKQETPAEMLM